MKSIYLVWRREEKQPIDQDDICLLFHMYLFFGLMEECVYLGQVEQSVSEV
jgi:hypothetical protein